MKATAQSGRQLALGLLWVYRNLLSPLKPPCCRFEPTCSLYARDAITRFGVLAGCWLALRRLLKCHPFYRGPAIDPVPLRSGPATKNREL